MKTTSLLLSLGVVALLSACGNSKDENPAGAWKSAAPESVTSKIEGATAASKTLTINFVEGSKDAPGQITLTANYDVTVPFVTDSVTNSNSYQVVASINGTWAKEKGEDDDYLLSFDTNSLAVNGTNAPELGPVTDEFLSSVSQFTKIEDVKVSKDGANLSFETDHPEVHYRFVRE